MSSQESDHRRFYDAESDHRLTVELEGPRLAKRDQFIARHRSPAAVLLEVGAGPGVDARAFVAAGFPIIGVDLAPRNAANILAGGVPACAASATQLPIRTNSVSHVWSVSTLMHLSEDQVTSALAEIRRVARTGASATIAVWGATEGSESEIQHTQFGRRHFHRRSATDWRYLLESHLGSIVDWDLWTSPLGEGWVQHWADLEIAGVGPQSS